MLLSTQYIVLLRSAIEHYIALLSSWFEGSAAELYVELGELELKAKVLSLLQKAVQGNKESHRSMSQEAIKNQMMISR